MIIPAIILKGKELLKRNLPKKLADAPNEMKITENPTVNKIIGNKSDLYFNEINSEYNEIRNGFLERKQQKEYITINDARINKFKIDWKNEKISKPNFLGVKIIENLDLNILKNYIDWSPFFRTWDLHGRYPNILDDEIVGKQATELFTDAQKMLEKIISEKWLTAKGSFGIFPANSIEDDIEIYASDLRKNSTFKFFTLRQQSKKGGSVPNIALADFIAPKETNIDDYIGTFCVSTGFGCDEKAKQYENNLSSWSI